MEHLAGLLVVLLFAAGFVTFFIGMMVAQDSTMVAGLVLLFAGAGLIAGALAFDTSVEGPRLYSSLPSDTRVNNLGRMQTQLIMAMTGAAAFMAGIVLMVAAKALEALAALKPVAEAEGGGEAKPEGVDSPA